VLQAHAPTAALERVVALRVHLDDSTPTNGPLRVIPGSQRHGVMEDDVVHALARASGAVDCLTPRGGVVVMRPLIVHASSKAESSAPRRVLHFEYADSLTLSDGAELAIA
jgi:ectoine hydroxylase-related dioxygenase (phytanoyl-CoA dioxygenase family)